MSLPWLRSKLLRQVYEIRLQSSSHMLSVLWFNEEFIILLYLSTICSPTTKLHYHKVISSYYYFEFIFILLFEERKHTVHAQWKMVKNVFFHSSFISQNMEIKYVIIKYVKYDMTLIYIDYDMKFIFRVHNDPYKTVFTKTHTK